MGNTVGDRNRGKGFVHRWSCSVSGAGRATGALKLPIGHSTMNAVATGRHDAYGHEVTLAISIRPHLHRSVSAKSDEQGRSQYLSAD